ncbi:MAG: hypothetical protein IPJ89_00155 [Candidatus Iainarchaeum archaeon]|uniref:OB-fold nucleic acid binding domain-containing protein n=1 Tax=Candidatus Iainarchaeum sp. TaxID=3101447 RepID=A0A7T9I1Q1_9ARCH|nr:MAG: hypothetical protein IPJ89_00155 [Candidatus Diapherotrites archaeon]
MIFSAQQRAMGWALLGIACLMGLAWMDAQALHHSSSLHALQSLPLPARVAFDASIVSVREVGSALLLELENNGKISCYWRKPPALRFFFPHERVRIQGKLELTPRGKLCVVDSLVRVTD